jgi:lactobin A/cerein 7B family class IIb bacteriocin
MASIKISDLHPSGFDLFGDSESFLDELNDNDLATINGGAAESLILAAVLGGVAIGGAVGFAVGYYVARH